MGKAKRPEDLPQYRDLMKEAGYAPEDIYRRTHTEAVVYQESAKEAEKTAEVLRNVRAELQNLQPEKPNFQIAEPTHYETKQLDGPDILAYAALATITICAGLLVFQGVGILGVAGGIPAAVTTVKAVGLQEGIKLLVHNDVIRHIAGEGLLFFASTLALAAIHQGRES